MVKNIQLVSGQIVYPNMNTKLNEEEYAKAKAHMWLYMLNEGKRPKKWLKGTKSGTKVNFDFVQSQSDYDQGLDELDIYLQEINKGFDLEFDLRRDA